MYINISSIFINRLLVDPRGTSQPKKLVLELWFNLFLNEYLVLDAVGVNLLITAFHANLEFLTLWICKRLTMRS